MKITITGSTGFVGINLQKYLKNLYEIETLSIRFDPNQQLKFRGDVVVHLAGKAHDLKKFQIQKTITTLILS